MVLSVDEKNQVQALARSQPTFPMMPSMSEKRTHDLRPTWHHQPVRGVQHRRRHGDLQPAPAPLGNRDSLGRLLQQTTGAGH